VLPPRGENIGGSHAGVGVVDVQDAESQWCSVTDGHVQYDDRIRCRQGSNPESPRAEDRWTVVSQMYINCLELLAASLAIQTFAKEEKSIRILVRTNNVSARAYINHFEGDSFMVNELLSHADMEVVHRLSDIPHSRTPPRSDESGSRRRIEGLLRLDAPSTAVFTDRGKDGNPRNGHVCIPAYTSTSMLFKLETGSSSRGDRCATSRLAGVCKSSMVSPLAYIGDNSAGESQSGPCGSNIEDSTMVPPPTSTVTWNPSNDPNAAGRSDLTNTGGIQNTSRNTTVSRLAIIRDQSQSGGLSEGASQRLESSWRNETNESLFKHWDTWCQEQGRDPNRGPVADILNFLAELISVLIIKWLQICYFLSS